VALVTSGNHAAVLVSVTEQDAVRRFYRDVLGCARTCPNTRALPATANYPPKYSASAPPLLEASRH
jgi:hypothetical protein